MPAAESSEAERSEAKCSGAAGTTGAGPDAPPRVDAEVPAKAKRRAFSAEHKKRILAEADSANQPGAHPENQDSRSARKGVMARSQITTEFPLPTASTWSRRPAIVWSR